MKRRKLLKASGVGFSCAIGSGIFFPKPAQSFELKALLSNSTVQNIFSDLVRYAAIKVIDGATTPPPPPPVKQKIETIDTELIQRGFAEDKTPLAKTASRAILWGRQKQEILGPNAGFVIAQQGRARNTVMAFTGPTSLGIDSAVKVLSDEKVSSLKAQAMLLPWREQFQDWATWEGDRDPSLGKLNVSFTDYRTRLGWVTRRYKLLEPGLGGRGIIETRIEADGEPVRTIKTDVRFA